MTENSRVIQENCLGLIAGRNANDEVVIEKVMVSALPEADCFQLLKSPLFVRGIARGDKIKALDKPKGAFQLLTHSGNLCIRVFSKRDITQLEPSLTHAMEELGGDLDIHEASALVYSIHVSCGFNAIEKLLDEHVGRVAETTWYYGNVYDPGNGEPLNWWHDILSPD